MPEEQYGYTFRETRSCDVVGEGCKAPPERENKMKTWSQWLVPIVGIPLIFLLVFAAYAVALSLQGDMSEPWGMWVRCANLTSNLEPPRWGEDREVCFVGLR